MTNEQRQLRFLNQKDSYANEGERMALLREIEGYVQSATSDPTKQKHIRQKLVQDSPDVFYTLYKDYDLSPQRKTELDNLSDKCSDRLLLNYKLMERLVNFGKLGSKQDKIALCQDVVSWLLNDSGIKPFQTNLPNIQVSVEQMSGINGYTLDTKEGHKIGINQERLNLDGTASDLFQTLLHETLHTTQKTGTATFTELNNLYYVDSSLIRKNKLWEGKAGPAYRNQPVEKEAWFFGPAAAEKMAQNYGYRSTIRTNVQNMITALTGEKCWAPDAVKYQQTSKGKFEVKLPREMTVDPSDLTHFFGNGINGFSRSSVVFDLGENETAGQLMDRITIGTQKLNQARKEREQFKKKLQDIFPTVTPLKTRQNGLLLPKAQPEIQAWIQSMNTNVSTKILPDGNLWIQMPLILRKNGIESSYSQAFNEQYMTLAGPNGKNYRVLKDGNGKPIVPESLKNPKPVSNHDLLRGASNSAQGQEPLDKHNAIDYRDVSGKDRKPEIKAPIRPTNNLEAERQRKREELYQQFNVAAQLAAKNGHKL